MSLEKNFLGSEGFVWFLGFVEDVDDPLKLGRVRVRAFGYHTQDKTKIPTDTLPWAQTCMPNTGPSLNQAGHSVYLKVGSMVFGFFMDATEAQQPLIVGSIPAFHDGEADSSRLFRNERTGETIHQAKLSGVDAETSDGKPHEPQPPYAATYPNNHVYQTDSHVQEFDDTPGKERIHTYHLSGSFSEIHPNGDWVNKTVGTDFKIIYGDSMVHIKGNKYVVIDGNATLLIKGNVKETVKGNVERTIDGNLTETVKGNVTRKITGSLNDTVTGSVSITHNATHSTKIAAAGKIEAGAALVLKGATIQLNP